MESASALKEKGNKEFTNGNFISAIRYYSEAIELKPDPAFYSNRAACYLNTKRFKLAIEDC